MKQIFLFILILFGFNCLAQYSSQNVSMYANWNDPSIPGEPNYGIKYNSVWGWVDPADNREYAILGASTGTYFIEVTNPSAPVMRDFVPGRRDSCIWREYKTYGNYVYMVSDDGMPNSFQIADMSYLPDSVHVVHDDVTIIERAHTLYIDGNKLYFGSPKVAGNYYSMSVYSLANPEMPALLRILSQDYPVPSGVHDMFVRNDTAYVSGGFEGLHIFKFETNNTFSLLGSITSYPDAGYNHSSWLTADGKTLVFCDEVPANLPVRAYNVNDLSNITFQSAFKSNEGATPHNPYIIGNERAVIAYYQDGVQIFDISDPANPFKTGFFDTDTLFGTNNGFPTSNTYHGCWGAYPFLPSGIVLASDMQNGLFILDASAALLPKDKPSNNNEYSISPNPFTGSIIINTGKENLGDTSVEIYDALGRLFFRKKFTLDPGTKTIALESENLSKGMYFLKYNSGGSERVSKLVKQ